MNYLEWINQCTPTRWWHDSGNPDEIELALKRGATGVTTNPVLTFRSFQSQPDFWNPKVLALGDDFPTLEAHAEALLKLVATYAADKVRDIYEKTNGADGYALGQLNPGRAGDAEGMLAQARRVHSWAPNIAVKLPATAAGIEVIEHLAEEGIPICATINVSVAQAIAVAEAYHEKRFLKLAGDIKEGRMFMRSKPTVWRCLNCGCLVEGTGAPDVCPACAHPKAYFEELNYTF